MWVFILWVGTTLHSPPPWLAALGTNRMATARVLITDINFLIRGERGSKKIGSLMLKSSRESQFLKKISPQKTSCQTSASQHDRLQIDAPVDKCVLREPKIFFITQKTRYVEHNFYSLEARKTGWQLICSRSEYLSISLVFCLSKECGIGKRWSKSKNLNKTKGNSDIEGKRVMLARGEFWIIQWRVNAKNTITEVVTGTHMTTAYLHMCAITDSCKTPQTRCSRSHRYIIRTHYVWL